MAAHFAGPRALEPALEGQHVILAVGDSHTYGVWCKPEQTYPGQLQSLLDRQRPHRFRVFNLGLPGMSSSQVRGNLQHWIEEHEPKTVVALAGLNNVWNAADAFEVDTRSRRDPWRLVRLVRILRGRWASSRDARERPRLQREVLEGDSPGVIQRDAETGSVLARHVGDPTVRSLSRQDAEHRLRADLEHMVAITSAREVRLILLTYAAFPLPGRGPRFELLEAMNEVIREVARRTNTELADPREAILEQLSNPEIPRTRLFSKEDDDHPSPVGYRLVAAEVFDRLMAPRREASQPPT